MSQKCYQTTDAYGTKRWYKGDKLHRDDGPAIEYANGDKEWYKDGKCHRDNGPAIERAYGEKYWYENGKFLDAEIGGIRVYEKRSNFK